MEMVRKLRRERGRANVLLVVFGGWPLHKRLPLSVHHAYAAIKKHQLLDTSELDLLVSYGVNTVTDLHGTLEWMKEHVLDVNEAYVATSKGHADRLVAESDMHTLFDKIYHIESNEQREHLDEDRHWSLRAKSVPSHQYIVGGRASDVTRFGSSTSLEWAAKMGKWAEANPLDYREYTDNIWRLVEELEANNVMVRSRTPGAWHLDINC